MAAMKAGKQQLSKNTPVNNVFTDDKKQKMLVQFAEATERGDAEKIQHLLQSGDLPLDIMVPRDGFGKSALSLAATYGQTAVVEQLLKSGADPTQKSMTGRIPLHDACIGGHDESVALLLDYMTAVDLTDRNQQTAVHHAAFNGEVKCLNLLAQKGANLIAKDNKGKQAAHLAAMRNKVKILQLLFDHNVDLDCCCSSGKTPLHYAAQQGALDSVICLVERDCDTTVGDKNSFLAAHLAARYDQLDCLRFLVQQGTALDAVQSEKRTPVHVAALYGASTVLHWLLEKGADVNAQDVSGNTPAHCAAEGGKAECFNCCLQHDADLTIPNAHGDTPLDAAKRAGHPLLMGKAIKNKVVCPHCYKKLQVLRWDEEHKPAPVEHNISMAMTSAYVPPPLSLPRQSTQLQKSLMKVNPKKKSAQKKLPERDLPAKYFGEYLDPNEKFQFSLK